MTITLVCGPMFSGKTSYILNYEKKCLISNKKYILINHSIDTRYSLTKLSSHDLNYSKSEKISCSNLSDLTDIDFNEYDVIIIDECQFFNDISLFLDKWSNKYIICSALNSDFQMNSFENTNKIFSRADKIVHLVSTCICGNDAPFTKRLSSDTKQTIVGSNDIYSPRCRKCFNL
jgi:thymidine kinase